MEFKERLKQYRLENGLTQEQFAKMLFISRSSVAKWEQGRSLPSSDMLSKIAELTGTPVDELINQGEVRSVTIGNQAALAKNKVLTRLFFCIAAFAFLISAANFLCFYLIKSGLVTGKTGNASVIGSPHFYWLCAKVESCGDSLILEDKNERTYDYAFSELDHVSFYARDGARITSSDICEGWYLKILLHGGLNYTAEELSRVEVIEDYVSDYKLYGYFISTTGEDFETMPIYYPSFGYNDPSAGYYLYDGHNIDIEFKYPYSFRDTNINARSRLIQETLIERKDQIYGINGIRKVARYSETYYCNINVDKYALKDKKIRIYAADNSPKGFYLFAEVGIGDSVTLKGHTYDESLREKALEERSYDAPTSRQIIFKIEICTAAFQQSLSFCTYDVNFEKLNEKTYSNLEELQIGMREKDYLISKNTMFYVIKLVSPPDFNITAYVGNIGDEVTYQLSNIYGFVYQNSFSFRIIE